VSDDVKSVAGVRRTEKPTTKRDFRAAIEELSSALELPVDARIDKMNLQELTEMLGSLEALHAKEAAPEPPASADHPDSAEGDRSEEEKGDDEAKVLEIPPSAATPSVDPPKAPESPASATESAPLPRFTVAPKRSIVCARGHLSAGDGVRPSDFGAGEARLRELIALGYVLERRE
jgi:hypothetical protein